MHLCHLCERWGTGDHLSSGDDAEFEPVPEPTRALSRARPATARLSRTGLSFACAISRTNRRHAERPVGASEKGRPRAACQEGAPVRLRLPPRRPIPGGGSAKLSAGKTDIAAKPRFGMSESPPRGTI